jgi:uncharacterized protein
MASSSPGVPASPASPASVITSLAGHRTALVALSGGVDSSVVAWLAFQALGERVVAVTLTGPAVAASEVDAATEAAAVIGIRHVQLKANPLEDPRYAGNPDNRCYFCRGYEGSLLRAWGREHDIDAYLDGVHVDDLGDDRPGLQAMDAHGFRHPLAEAGWTKVDVRSFARSVALPTWDRPSNACLASRIAHGQPITAPLLLRIGDAEEWLAQRGFRRVRVRVSGTGARVEVDPEEVARLAAPATAGALRAALLGLGFTDVAIDPDGYRPRANA